jgi:hypothetical protein
MAIHCPGYLLSLLSPGLAGRFRLDRPNDAWRTRFPAHIARTLGRPKIGGFPDGEG